MTESTRRGKKLLSDASFRAPLLCRSDGSSQSNFPTMSLIKAACRAGEAVGTVAPPHAPNPPQEDRLHRTLPQGSVRCWLTLHCHIRAFRQSACPCSDNCLKACPCGNSWRRGCTEPCKSTPGLTRASHPRCDSRTDHICERHMVEFKCARICQQKVAQRCEGDFSTTGWNTAAVNEPQATSREDSETPTSLYMVTLLNLLWFY